MAVGTQVPQSSAINDVISALMNLGYQKPEILRTISTIEIDRDPQFDTLLRQVLTKLSAGV